jgi:hypothetical protein
MKLQACYLGKNMHYIFNLFCFNRQAEKFTPFCGEYKTDVKFYFHISVNYKLGYWRVKFFSLLLKNIVVVYFRVDYKTNVNPRWNWMGFFFFNFSFFAPSLYFPCHFHTPLSFPHFPLKRWIKLHSSDASSVLTCKTTKAWERHKVYTHVYIYIYIYIYIR